jgi:hypothetical protein
MNCQCFRVVNAKLEKHNTMLDMRMCLNREDGRMTLEPQLAIVTVKIDSKNRVGPKTLLASFCPFCGKSLTAKPKAQRKK